MKTKKILPFLLLLLPASPLLSQSVSPPGSESEEFVELSPFVVSAEEDSGYVATQTLAGTRLKTNVKDVAASIQILTSEFLRDVGANDLNDLFLYTTNTEASGLNGNFSDAVTGETSIGDEATRVNPQGSQRVRGLAAADVTRNYFLTVIPTDRFNTDRVEINRGANAILFGLGSPAGIANTSLSPAQFRTFGKLEVQFDSEGSFRTELEYSKELLEDRLSVRIGALLDQTDYYQRPAFEDDKRVYGALLARPWKNGTVRAFAESGSRDANRPSTIPPSNTVDSWFGYNPVVRDLMRSELAANGVDLPVPDDYTLAYDAYVQDFFTNNYLKVADVNKDGVIDARDDEDRLALLMNQVAYHKNVDQRYVFHPNMSRQIARVFEFDQPVPGGVVGGVDAFMSNVNSRNFNPTVEQLPPELDPSGNGRFNYLYLVSQQPWRQDRLLIPESMHNLEVFDFTRNLISGESGFQNDKWRQYNATFEQTAFNNNLGVEIAVDRQTYERESFVSYQGYTGIFLDLMKNYLSQDNPNFGRPFAQARTSMIEVEDERTTIRVTPYLRFNAADMFEDSRFASWLGEHTITGLYNDYDQSGDRTS